MLFKLFMIEKYIGIVEMIASEASEYPWRVFYCIHLIAILFSAFDHIFNFEHIFDFVCVFDCLPLYIF